MTEMQLQLPFSVCSLGKRHLGHMDLDWFCKILVSLAVPPVQINVPPTKLLAIMCSLKTSVPTFK